MGNVKKYKTKCAVLAAHRSLETLCVLIDYLCQGDHEGRQAAICGPLSKAAQQRVHSDQPTQPNSTEVVQLLSRRDVLETLEAAEELKVQACNCQCNWLAVPTSVPPCFRASVQHTATCSSGGHLMRNSGQSGWNLVNPAVERFPLRSLTVGNSL